jgi:hypothetical protein
VEAPPSFLRLAWRSGLFPAGLFFALVGGIFAAAGAMRLSAELRYRREGVPARAAVISKSIEHASGKRTSTGYLVGYRFATRRGATMEGRDEVDADRWDELNPGDPFEIVYLPESPQTNRATSTTQMPLAIGFTAMGGFTLLVGAGALAAAWRTAARQLSARHQPGVGGLERR